MTDNESIDEIVDDILNDLKKDEKEIDKRKPKPFRYISNKELKDELKDQENKNITIMKPSKTPTILPKELCVLGLGDVDTIENIIQRHEASRKLKDK